MDGVGTAREDDGVVGSQFPRGGDVLLEDAVGFPTVAAAEEDAREQSLEMDLGLEFVGVERGGAEVDDGDLLGDGGGGGVAEGEERGELLLVHFLLNCQRGGLYIKVRQQLQLVEKVKADGGHQDGHSSHHQDISGCHQVEQVVAPDLEVVGLLLRLSFARLAAALLTRAMQRYERWRG